MRKIFLTINLVVLAILSCYSQGIDCSNAEPFCTGTSYTYPASVNVPDLGQVGCLFTTPNPAWYYLQVDNAGNIIIDISSGGDVDFICWGPFTSLAAACATNLMTSTTYVDCSYSIAAAETCDIIGAASGQVYVLLITNYANIVTNISFQQSSGTGSTDCSIVAPPITCDSVCEGETIFLSAAPVAGATYAWSGPNGFTSVSQNPTIPFATTASSGVYSLIITVGGVSSSPVACTVVVNAIPVVSPIEHN